MTSSPAPCTSVSGHGRPGRDAAGTGGRGVLRDRGAWCCRRRCSGTCRRGHLRHGPRRDSTCGARPRCSSTIRASRPATAASRRAWRSRSRPAPGQAIDRRQGGADVKIDAATAVGPSRAHRACQTSCGEDCRPGGARSACATQLPQLVRKLIGRVKLGRSLNLGEHLGGEQPTRRCLRMSSATSPVRRDEAPSGRRLGRPARARPRSPLPE